MKSKVNNSHPSLRLAFSDGRPSTDRQKDFGFEKNEFLPPSFSLSFQKEEKMLQNANRTSFLPMILIFSVLSESERNRKKERTSE